jgi:hypothetical protein
MIRLQSHPGHRVSSGSRANSWIIHCNIPRLLPPHFFLLHSHPFKSFDTKHAPNRTQSRNITNDETQHDIMYYDIIWRLLVFQSMSTVNLTCSCWYYQQSIHYFTLTFHKHANAIACLNSYRLQYINISYITRQPNIQINLKLLEINCSLGVIKLHGYVSLIVLQMNGRFVSISQFILEI